MTVEKTYKDCNPVLFPFFQEINPVMKAVGIQGIATITGMMIIAKNTSESNLKGILSTAIRRNAENQKNRKLLTA
jgi:hypothetical protein